MNREDPNTQKLKSRYLVWLYKTTKEALDRIDRKFTQLEVDKALLKYLEKEAGGFSGTSRKGLEKFINDFREYIAKKEKEGKELKFTFPDSKEEKADYLFLELKLKGIEKRIEARLGKKALAEIRDLYEQEMLRRIIEEREHR